MTEAHIVSAERSLYRARLDIQQRTRSLALATSSAAREAEATASMSYFSRLTTRAPAAAHLASSQVEVKALESLEGQMVRDLGAMKKRKEVSEMGRTVKGRIWLAAGWALSVYCVWRVFVVSLSSLERESSLIPLAVLHQPRLWVLSTTPPCTDRRRTRRSVRGRR